MGIWNSKEYINFVSCLCCVHCELFEENQEYCIGNTHPACGGCHWAEGVRNVRKMIKTSCQQFSNEAVNR